MLAHTGKSANRIIQVKVAKANLGDSRSGPSQAGIPDGTPGGTHPEGPHAAGRERAGVLLPAIREGNPPSWPSRILSLKKNKITRNSRVKSSGWRDPRALTKRNTKTTLASRARKDFQKPQ